MKAVRRIESDRVRQMCIRHEYYTCGDNRAYSQLLQYVGKIDADNIHEMKVVAENIFIHSDTNHFLALYGCSEDEFKDNILFNLYNECCTTILEGVKWL